MSAGWKEFLHNSDIEMRRNDMNRGLGYEPDPGMLTVDAVEEYIEGFGWCGASAREVIQAVRRDERGVKRALHTLVEDGKLRVTESLTRGPKASKRKTYWPVQNKGPVHVTLSEFTDLAVAGRDNEHGCGGGRKVSTHCGPAKSEFVPE